MNWHWLEQSAITSAAFSAGAIYQWYMQKGTCKSCRIRYSVRRVLRPLAERMARQAQSATIPGQLVVVLPALLRVTEVALAFAFWDTMKLGWHLILVPYAMNKFRRKNG